VSENRYILLVEDSPSQALRLKRLIQHYTQYPVEIAHTGIEGWNRARALHPLLVLLDINLPTLDGFQILDRLKRNYATATIPVVMLTSYDRIGDVERAIELGADGYLFKEDCLFTYSDQLQNALVDILKDL
jgi:CheY-like chemotaxis protein